MQKSKKKYKNKTSNDTWIEALPLIEKQKKKKTKTSNRHKYGAIKCEYGGYKFDSQLERDVYLILEQLKEKGEITEIKLQQKFPLRSHSGKEVGKYIADFVCLLKDGSTVVVEAKGKETPVWRWKEKHFRQDYDLRLVVVKRGDMNDLKEIICVQDKRVN